MDGTISPHFFCIINWLNKALIILWNRTQVFMLLAVITALTKTSNFVTSLILFRALLGKQFSIIILLEHLFCNKCFDMSEAVQYENPQTILRPYQF